MQGYVIAMIDVTDMDVYRDYMKLSPAAIEKYGGKFLTRGGRTTLLEGEKMASRMVLFVFPTYELALEFYHSPEYTAARNVREGAAIATFVALEGV